MGSRDISANRDTANADTADMEAFKGKYERTSADKYEELLKELEVNFLLRKAATVSTPVMEVTEDGGVWTIKTSTTLKTMELKFKLGEPFDETTPDGREVTAVCSQEGEKSTKSTREMNGPDELIYTMTIDGSDIVCV